MNFEKLYEDSQLPVIKTKFSAGIDLYSHQDIEIQPSETVVVGLGVRSIFTEPELRAGNNKCFILELRSSMRAKGLTSLGTGIIDMDYRGEWLQVVCNLSKEPYTVKKGSRIAQAVMISHMTGTLDKYNTFEARAGGFGSTGE